MPNVDRRLKLPGREARQADREGARAERVAAVEKLRAQVPGVRVDFDDALGSPKFVASTRGFLASGAEPRETVRSFLDANAAMFGHGAAVLDEARVVRDYETAHNGLRTLVWQQEVAGVRVFESTLQAHVTKGGELVNIASRLVPDPAKVGAKPARMIDVKSAISAAGASVGETLPPAQIAENAPPEGPARKQKFRSTRLLDVSAETVWLPEDETALRLCWEVIFTSKARGEMFRALVDGESGEVVVRQGLTEYISDATYQVFTSDSPSPLSPGHPSPLSTQPPVVARTMVTTPALNTTASPNGWIDDGVNETRGNNVDAHTDLNADNIADTPRPQGSPNRVFAPALDLTQAPSTYTDAAVVDLFYWNNLIHDRFYELGFTEAAGNFQNNNFGRGGSGNDAVQADAQDGSGTNNANFSTPPDGSPGRMQMFVFTGPAPDRDGDFDHDIVIHEYTHGLSNRLVGGGVGISALQTRGMGEGWSDFYGLCLLSQPADDPNAVYAVGGYATYLLSGMTTNYYFGIRRYPYCTDLAKNPLGFRDIDPTQARAHTGIPLSPRYSFSNQDPAAVHGQGEVWCVTLWDARANLIAKHGATAGNNLILQLVTDGMKLAPANPNFLQARDAIIQADLVANAGANYGELWTAFAKRGMGANATSPASSTTTGVVENYDVPDDLAVAPGGAWTASGTIGSPFSATNAYTLTNTGTAQMSWTAAKTQPWLALSATGGTLAPGASVTVTASLTAAATSLVSGTYLDTITFTNATSGFAQTRAVELIVEPITVPIASEDWESGAIGSAWTITGTNTHRTLVTTANAPRGGSYHLTMDSSTELSLSRNEATWTVDLAGRRNVQLRFWAKEFSDEAHGPPTTPFTGGADFDGVAISANGTTWYEVQPLRTLAATWTRYEVDLDAALATYGLSYNSAFKIRFNHYDDYPITTDGFAFDDIELVETIDLSLTLALPAAAVEGAGALSGTITAIPAPATNLTIALESSDPGQASVPASVTILAGQPSATFPISVIDDALLDGTQSSVITAMLAGYASGVGTIVVHDNESGVLTLTVPAPANEGDGSITATLSVNEPVAADVSVALASSNAAELQVPASVIIPAGEASVSFPVTVIDDTRIDGTVTTTLTAQVTGWTAASTAVAVADNESTALTVVLPASVREGDGPKTGLVRIAGTLGASLSIALASDDPGELAVPASVTIAAGRTSVAFAITPVDDALADGAQPATVSASAGGFTAGVATTSVQDNELSHFTFAPIASPQIPNAPFAVTVTARDVNGAAITNYAGSATLSGAGAPIALSGWADGVKTVNVTIASPATGVVLTAADDAGHTGASNAFDVAVGAAERFVWAPVPSPQTRENFFPVTITALDAGNNVASGFNGTANLRASVPATAQFDVGTGTFGTNLLNTVNHDSRVQTLYLASELGGPRRISAIALYYSSAPTQTLNAWTIRMKHTTSSSTSGSWDASGWTTVHQSNFMLPGTTWVTFQFPTPFDYDGTSNLLIDFSFNNAAAGSTSAIRFTTASTTRTRYYSTDSAYGDPLTWSGTTTPGSATTSMLNVRFTYAAEPVSVPLNPPVSGSFVGGVWTGNVAVPVVANGVQASADDGAGLAGTSNVFDVQAVAAPAVFSEDFENPALGPWWTITGTNNYRAMSATGNTPHGGARHLLMDASVSGAFSRTEATLTVNLAGRTGVSLSFWAKEFLDESHGPPTTPFTGGADFDGVAISADGVTWYEVQALRTLTSAYAQFTVNLDAAIATHGLSYTPSFRIRFNQYDEFPITSDGIAIDDIAITAATAPAHTVSVPAQAAENAGALTGTVTLGSAAGANTVVSLASTASARVAVPASVTVPTGQSSANFAIAVLDNAVADGDRVVGIVATPPGGVAASATLLIVDDEVGALTLTAPASATEGSAVLSGTLTLSVPAAAPLTFSFVSSDTTEVTVPSTVTVPAGQSSVNFPVTIVNDTLLDGPQSATITASATGWASATADVAVLDNDTTNMSFSLATTATEGGAALTGFVILGSSKTTSFTVALTSSDPSEVTVPATVTIPANVTSASFTATIVDDVVLDGPQTATITATSSGYNTATTTVTVADNETASLTLTLPATASEGETLAGTATIGFAMETPLTVALASSDTTEVTLPGSVTIPAGSTSAAFSATAVNDGLADGTQTATITASATGYASSIRTVTVNDNQLHHFTLSDVATPQTPGAPFIFTVTAKTATDTTIANYAGPVTLIGPAGVTPTTLSGWSGGVWSGSVTVPGATTGATLTVNNGAGITATSNAFDLVALTDQTRDWPTFGNGPAHTGYQPVTLGAGAYVAGWTKTYPVPTYGMNQAVVSNGRVYVTPNAYYGATYLSALDVAAGTELWRKTFANSFGINPPTVNAGKVYAQRESPGELWCLDAVAGTTLWTAAYGTQAYRHYAPTVVGNGVWINGGTYGGLYGFNVSNGSQRFFNSSLAQFDLWTPTYYAGTIYSWVGGVFRAHDPQAGTVLWSSTVGATASNGTMNTVSAIDAGRAFVIGSPNFYAIDLTTRTTAWTVTGSFKGSPAVQGGVVFALLGSDVKAYSATSGTLLGTYATGSSTIAGQPIVTDDSVIVASPTATYIFNRATYTLRETLASGGTPSLASGVIYLAGNDGVLRTFNPPGLTPVTVATPASASEGSAPLTATVTLSQEQGTSTVLNLASSAPTRLTVPASVTIPAGQTSASFSMTVVNDTLLNGSTTVAVTAKGPTPLFLTGAGMIVVNDNETATLSVNVPASASEAAGSVTGTVTVSAAPVGDIVVSLASSNTTAATVPATVTILAGQTSATFSIALVDDSAIDGTQSAAITASVTGWTGGSGTIAVLDNETTTLSLSASSVTEGSTGTGYIYLSGTLASPLTVTLASANTGRLTVPASITIPAGSTSGSFSMTAPDNVLTDGAASVNVTASAVGFTSGSSNVTVYDNDLHHFTLSSIGATQISNQPFTVYFYARTVDETSVSYTGTATLSVTAGGVSLPVTPATVTFSGSSVSAAVRVNGSGTGAVLKVEDGAGRIGTSTAFNVGPGALSTLAWSTVPATVTPFTPFTATITARDTYGNTVTGFNGTASITAGTSATTAIGAGTGVWEHPLNTFWHDARTQCIYLASELGGARRFNSLALNVSNVPGQTMNAWTIRMKHTAQASYASGAQWESTGWTTVHQSNATVSGTGWVTFVFATPFDYDGTSNLLVDFSFNNSTFTSTGYTLASTTATARACYYFTDSGWGDPLTWSGTSPSPITSALLPNLRLRTEGLSLPVNPTSATFTNGTWTGPIDLGGTGTGLVLTATSGSVAGESNAFTSAAAAALGVTPSATQTTSGNRGGSFTPLTHTFTVRNGGSGSMAWTASETLPWLSLAPGGGTLSAGASTTVTATLDAAVLAALPSGNYDGTIAFTNTTSGLGNTTRTVRVTAAAFGELAVSPAADASVTGPFGGPFATRDFTLRNNGDAPLDWTAGKTAPWLVLSSAAGTLAPGASTVVTASFAAAALNPGAYADTITFTNTSHGAGTTARAVALTIELPAPVLAPEPPITPATSNTVSWSAVNGATHYEAQIATEGTFASPASSGWEAATSATFSGLSDSVQYFYRARARRYFPDQIGTWVQTTQGDFDADVKTDVATTPAGSVVLATRDGREIAGRITNPSFENSLTGWTSAVSTNMGATTSTTATPPMPTAGARYANVFTSHNQPHNLGDSSRLTQSVDLTGIGTILFDAVLTNIPGGTWAGAIRGEVRIDGITVWSATAPGVYRDQAIDVSFLPGVHEIELRNEVLVAGTYASQWVLFDNLRTHEPADGNYRPAGTLVSTPIAPAGRLRWGRLKVARDVPAGAALSVDVLAAGGDLLAADVPSDTDLHTLAAVADAPSIKLRANFSTADAALTPRLDEWSVEYLTAVEMNDVSAWSNVETSTQFNAPPTISPVADQTLLEDAAMPLLPLVLGDDMPPDALQFAIFNSNPALLPEGAIEVTGSGANRLLQVSPAPDQFGLARVTLRVTDEGGKSAEVTFNVIVAPVNDPPAFVRGADQRVEEDAGAQSVPRWASAIAAGPANEAGQALDFLVSQDNAALFATAPAIAANGTLTFTPAPDANGTATVTVRLRDSGGTANGGSDTSAPQTFTITVVPVNDTPAFVKGADPAVLEDSGPQSMPGWAAVGARPGDEAGQALEFLVSTDHAALFSAAPALDAAGRLSFTPAPDANGSASVTVRLRDDGGGSDTSAAQSFTITIAPVNDAPAFAKGTDQTLRQTAGAQTIAGWATALSRGPTDEAGQALDFLVSHDRPEMFAAPPAIAPDGTLTFTPSGAANGVATVTVRLHDDGGTSDGGSDTSAAETFTIAMSAVNDAPSFVPGPDLAVAQDAGPQRFAAWATEIRAGPSDEAGQALEFRVSVDDAALFAVPPALAADGTLTFAPAPTASGAAIVTVRLHDDSGTADDGSDTSEPHSFTIAVTSMAEEPGTYNGLVRAPDGTAPAAERSGLVRVSIARGGAFTGRLTLGGRRQAMKGNVDHAGVAHFSPGGATARIVPRGSSEPVGMSFAVDVSGGTDTLAGTLTSGSGSPFAVLAADRALFTARRTPAAPWTNVPAELLGAYTVVFTEADVRSIPPVPDGVTQIAGFASPRGFGSGIARVGTDGQVHLNGTLADGRKVTYANALSKAHAWPLYHADASGYALSGPVVFRDVPAVSDVDGRELLWCRPFGHGATARGSVKYGMRTDLVGSKYERPRDGEPVLPGLRPPAFFGNAMLTLAGGGLLAPLEEWLRIDGHRRAEAIVPNVRDVGVSFAVRTGLFRGQFTHPASGRAVKLHGAVLQKQSRGFGAFRTESQAGSVQLAPR